MLSKGKRLPRTGTVAVPGCPGAAAFELLGRKWTSYLVWALIDGPKRFSQLRRLAPGLTDRVLAARLKWLEAAGIVSRAQFNEVPVRVEYALTERGRDLVPVIEAMERWGRRWSTVASPATTPTTPMEGGDSE
jgi:DNA-binding HxlR family transcriptional regulator